MEPGDLVLYNGVKMMHWRDANDSGGKVYQVFFHYVDADGPYAKHADEIKTKQGEVFKNRRKSIQ